MEIFLSLKIEEMKTSAFCGASTLFQLFQSITIKNDSELDISQWSPNFIQERSRIFDIQ